MVICEAEYLFFFILTNFAKGIQQVCHSSTDTCSNKTSNQTSAEAAVLLIFNCIVQILLYEWLLCFNMSTSLITNSLKINVFVSFLSWFGEVMENIKHASRTPFWTLLLQSYVLVLYIKWVFRYWQPSGCLVYRVNEYLVRSSFTKDPHNVHFLLRICHLQMGAAANC